ncbi:anti-sigma factor family protein [Anaerotignum sp. MB30-C6]|uniref:anti-sigma factor family protein n=1 Tax=Anaerotignum sp. MB30-C6 TaxID=3070814 RepID=UPI0027DDB4D6|nr:zf-HC2 domain-containing protein [Anaerotignum sp. MB30-C6]WMI81871.1 anti-sigma factor [Anaerotignum sp. MB30-C6]
MSCDKCRELLWGYLAQELTKEDADFVATHLAECTTCKEEAFRLQEIMDSLKNLPEEELPEGYHNELMGKLAQEIKVVPFPVRKKPQYKWKQFSLIAAAALLVVAVGGAQGILSFRGNQQNEIAQEMARDVTKGTGSDFAQNKVDAQQDVKIVVEEDVSQIENYVVAEDVVQEKNIVSVQGEASQVEMRQRIPLEKASPEKEETLQSAEESVPPVVSQEEEIPLPMSIAQDEAVSEQAKEAPRSVDYTLMGDNIPLEAQQQVILTVKNKEGVLESIRDLVITLGGYEQEQAVADNIKVSVPSGKAEDFEEGLKALGETRKIEVSSKKTDFILFEVTIESK